MQNVFVEKPYKFVPPMKSTLPLKIIMYSGIFKRWLRKLEGVVASEVRNADKLRDSMAAGHSIVLAPNHSRTADPMVLGFLGLEAKCTFYAMASWHLFNQSWFYTTVVRSMGAFSVNREGVDRQAIDTAIDFIAKGERVFTLFPEGTTSRANDKLMKLMDGTSFIARAAAKKRAKRDGGKVMVHPLAIKYVFQGDIKKVCEETLSDIERRISWRPQTEIPMFDRITKLGSALLKLKELEYGATDDSGSLTERQQRLVNHLLHPLEMEWLGKTSNEGIQIRIKNLRMQIFPEIARGEVDSKERTRRWRHLEDTYLAQQLDGYPKDYVAEFPSENRILETLERFEEDLTDKARIHGDLKVILDVLDPIEVSTVRDRSAVEDPLMLEIRESLQGKLDELKHESRMYQE